MHLRDFLTFHGAEDLSRINSPLAGAAGGKGEDWHGGASGAVGGHPALRALLRPSGN